MFSNKVLKRFVKDYKLPIQVIQQPYFEYFLDLYNADYNAKEKYKLLEQVLDNPELNSKDELLKLLSED
jgi:hypothetical protein